jgi:hypothetical protein
MPKQRASIADVLKDGDDLLASVAANAALLGDIDTTRLQAAIAATRPRIAQQINFQGEKKQATRVMRQQLKELREAAFHLRAAIRGKLGPRHPKLDEFGVTPKPERQPRRRKATPPTTPPTNPSTEPGGPVTPPPTPVP